MSQITSIEPQKKKASRFNIFIDGKFAVGVSDQTLLEHQLKIGKDLTQVDIQKIISREQITKLTDFASNFLSYRPRSEKEVVEHLAKKIAQREGIKFGQAMESPVISEVVIKLKKYKYINDLEFARWYIESRSRSRPRGSILIKQELKMKGISENIIENLLKNNESDLTLAKKALDKKITRWQKLPDADLKKKVYQFLSSRGFDFETIKETFAILKNLR